MEDSEEKERGFKVQDRRRFSAEGEAKPETEESIKSEAEKSAPQNSAAQSELNPNRGGSEAAAGTGAKAQYATMGAPQPNPAGGPEPEITFATFLVGLSSEALALLGEIPDPVTGAQRRDLPAAQQLIDIIGVLHDKTRGNLDHNEQSLIEAILFDLRMKYVELARPQSR